MSYQYKRLTKNNIKLLSTTKTPEQLKLIDERLDDFLNNKPENTSESSCCNKCSNCKGFIAGRWPRSSVLCNRCNHHFEEHIC